MLNDKLIQELNRGYICPDDAGPAWRTACEYGFDMSLVERAMSLSAEQRIDEHQQALDMLLELNPNLGSNATE